MIKKILLMFGLAMFVVGCSENLSPDYTASDIGVSSKVMSGIIVGKRAVKIDNNSSVGGIAGATAGAAAGSMLGDRTATKVIGGVGGAVVGGFAGNQVDKSLSRSTGYEYLVKLENGKTVAIVQSEDMQFAVDQHVLVISGRKTRIVPDTLYRTF